MVVRARGVSAAALRCTPGTCQPGSENCQPWRACSGARAERARPPVPRSQDWSMQDLLELLPDDLREMMP
eukprot:4900656-Prymnesium_polylepis.1